MKKLIGIVAFFICVNVSLSAQDVISKVQFWGIPLGSKKDFVENKMLAMKGVLSLENGMSYLWKNLPDFAGFETKFSFLEFTKEGLLSSGSVILQPSNEDEIFNMYSSLKELFVKKYGTPKKESASFESPYSNKDPLFYKKTAVKTNKCKYFSRWEIDKGEDAVGIVIYINEDFTVWTIYTHNKLNAIRDRQIDEGKMEDI